MAITLWKHQQEALELIRDSFRKGKRTVMLQLPCGSGKTILAMSMIHSAVEKGKRVAFVVDNLELLEQASQAADKFGIPHGIIQSTHWRTNKEHPLQICTIQTLKNKYKDFSFVIVDEAHCMYKAQLEWMERHNNVPFIGLSATPWAKGLGKHWECLIKPLTTGDLIDIGKLAPFIAYAPETPDLADVAIQAGDYNQKQLGKAVNKHKLVASIVKTWLERGDNRQTLAFCVDIAHSEAVAEEFRAAGILSEAVHSKLDPETRRDRLDRFAAGDIKVLTSRDVLTKGYDNPAASCLILARPTKSRMIHVQQVGRVIRTTEGKDDAVILDHAGNHLRMGFITDPSPDYLDIGEKKDQSTKQKEEIELKPKECPKCKFLKPAGIRECPKCGFTPTKQSEVVVEDGKLKRLSKRKREVSVEEKKRFYSELLYIAESKNYKTGWAAWKHKERFGHFPHKKTGIRPAVPSAATFAYLKHLAIKRSYGQKKKVAMDTGQHARTG